MHALPDLIDLVLAVLAIQRECAHHMREESLPAFAAGGDRFKASVPEERGELGRPIECGPPNVVPFRPLHPCDDTRAGPTRPERISIVEVAPRDGLQAAA